MNQTFTQAVPYAESGAADGSQWVDVNHFDGGRVAALRYRFDPGAGRLSLDRHRSPGRRPRPVASLGGRHRTFR